MHIVSTTVDVVVKASAHVEYEQHHRNRGEIVGRVLSGTEEMFQMHSCLHARFQYENCL